MSETEIGRLAYLVLLGLAVGGWFMAEHRRGLGRALRQALVWGFLFIGVIAGYGLWSDIRQDVAPRQMVFGAEGRIEVPRAFDGHYYLTLEANGTPVEFVVDTGASDIVLSQQDARRIGIDPEALAFLGTANTANGRVRTAEVRIGELALGPFRDRDLRALVTGGEMQGSLLGMGYLQRYSRIEIADGLLVLTR